MRTRFRGHLPQVLLISVLAAIVGPNGVAHGDGTWPTDGTGICTGGSDHVRTGTVSDGLGGTFVLWEDTRTGAHDLYALRIDDSGQPAMGWPACGMRVCSAAGNQQYGIAVSDRHGGVIVLWDDDRSGSRKVYAQRLDINGNLEWNPDGVRACDADSLELLEAAT